jgi:CPA1 family monovalent cation:H+ antiporter
MDGHSIVIFIITVLISTLIGKKLQDTYNIPLPISLITIFISIKSFINTDIAFGTLVVVLLPLLLISDALHLKIKDLKANYISITYMAFTAVILSVVVGTITMTYILPNYPIVFYVLLFSIIMATDAISVSAIFSKFTVIPKKIKLFAEAESLFNDATAVIIFTLVAVPLSLGYNVSPNEVLLGTIEVLTISTLIGIVYGYIFSYIISLFHETIDEFLIIPLIAYCSFITAEHFEVSGILAVIASIVVFKNSIMKNIENFVNINDGLSKSQIKIYGKYIILKQRLATTKERLLENEKIIEYVSFIAVAVLFASLGSVISISELLIGWKEILIVFFVTTLIRCFTFVPMVLTKTINLKDTFILTFGGVKGGLAVLLLYTVPTSFEFKEDLQVIVFGQIVLSTFIYVGLLLILIPKFYKEVK